MNKLFIFICLILTLAACRAENNPNNQAAKQATTASPAKILSDDKSLKSSNYDAGAIAEAFAARRNLPQVIGSGTVERILKDDTNGLKHQKFLLKISPTIKIGRAHV